MTQTRSLRAHSDAGNRPNSKRGITKSPTGISGLDEILQGGLPKGRPTLVCGSAGSGKTLLAMEFIVRGITEFGEPGVFMSFEETAEELAKNVTSLGFDVQGLIQKKKLAIDYVYIERSEIEETGEYDLEGLFVRLGSMIDELGAKRVAIDSLEALFGGLPNEGILRAELRRLFRWLKKKGVTTVITGEQGEQTLTRHNLEEYISDCVIFLDHRLANQVATRRLRVVKYRGSKHGTNEYPTLIDEDGLSILPISSLGMNYPVSAHRVSTGVAGLDAMLGGKGYYRGSSVLVSGTAGTGKTSLAAAFVDSVCRAGGKAIFFSFEESSPQLIRNMASIGIDLEQWQRKGRLKIHSLRPSLYGLEMHLASMHKLVTDFQPQAVVMDPVTNLTSIGSGGEIKAMLSRLIDFLKNQAITVIFTSLTGGGLDLEQTEVGMSSLMDTWLLVKMLETSGERNRLLYVLKSRGMAHSNQVREFLLTDRGLQLREVYVGPGEVLTGASRLAQESRDRAEATAQDQQVERRVRELRQQQMELAAQAQSLQGKLSGAKRELELLETAERQRRQMQETEHKQLLAARKGD